MTSALDFIGSSGGQAVLGAAGQLGAAALGAQASSRAGGQLAAGAQAGRADIQAAITQGRGDITAAFQPTLEELQAGAEFAEQGLQPIAQPGVSAFQIQAAQSGALGPEAQRQAFAAFQASPEQAFLQQQGEQAITRQAAATGGLGGARVLEALQERGQGLAAQQFGQQFQRLGQVAQPGIQAQTGISNILQQLSINRANVRQATGTGLANIAVGAGPQQAQLSAALAQAQAAGTLGRGSALQQGLGGVARGGGQATGFAGQAGGFNQPVGTTVGGQTLGDFGRAARGLAQGAAFGSSFGPIGTIVGGIGGFARGGGFSGGSGGISPASAGFT